MVREAVILAAGQGRRLQPFTDDMPKVMLPIANKPILEYVVDALSKNGINDIIMVVGYKKEKIMNYFGDGSKWKLNIKYAYQEKQLGTGHALLQAEQYVKGEELLVLPGDNIIDKESISQLIKSHTPSVILEESEIPSKYGVVNIEGEKVKKIVEKPYMAESNLVSTGIYKFNRDIFGMIKKCVDEGRNSLTEVIQELIKQKEFYWIMGNKKWKDAVYPWNLLEMNSEILQAMHTGIGGKIEENVIIKGDVFIGKDTIIHSGSYIKGPVIIGEGCEIGPNTCIFPSTSIGNNVTIYPFSEIRNSIIMDDSTIGSNSSISNSIVGKGNKISNKFSVEVKDAIMEIEGEFHKVKDIGAFIGSNCIIGANVTIEGGKIVENECEISSQKLISRNIPKRSKVM